MLDPDAGSDFTLNNFRLMGDPLADCGFGKVSRDNRTKACELYSQLIQEIDTPLELF